MGKAQFIEGSAILGLMVSGSLRKGADIIREASSADGNKIKDPQQTIMQGRETLEHSVLNGISPSNPSLQSSNNSPEKGGGKS